MGRVDTAEALMRLAGFRRGVYDCFTRWPDALFEVTDALAAADRRIRSVAGLTLEGVGHRGWGSFYQALNHGGIDTSMAADLLVGQIRAAPPPGVDGIRWPPLFAIDASVAPRPDTTVVPDVGMHYADRVPRAVVTPGWTMSWLCQVGELTLAGARTSWALPMHVRRVPTSQTITRVASAQLADLATRPAQASPEPVTGPVPLVLFDAGYAHAAITQHLPTGIQILVRLRSNQVFRGRPPTRPPGSIGRPPLHGRRFAFKEPAGWGPADARSPRASRPCGSSR